MEIVKNILIGLLIMICAAICSASISYVLYLVGGGSILFGIGLIIVIFLLYIIGASVRIMIKGNN